MTQLEDKILKKVYRFETRRTVIDIFIKFLGILVFGGIWMILGIILIQIIKEQQTLDILHIFFEDQEILQEHFWSIVSTLSYELPFFPILIAGVSFIIFIYLVLILVKHSGKILKKISAILKYNSHKN